MLRWLPVTLLGIAGVVVGAGLLQAQSVVLLLAALALILAAATFWRLAQLVALDVQESRAWSQLAQLEVALAHREGLWSALPAAAAVWDSHGDLLMTTEAWRALRLDGARPPDTAELVVGDPPRALVVDTNVRSDGTRLIVLRDVTREREAIQAKDELLAVVGHEMRTPLSSIKGYGQLMARQLATVQEQVQRLDRLIADVLDTARAEAGRLTLRRRPVAVSEVINSAVERLRGGSPTRQVDVKLASDAFIEGDPERLGQVMDNLLSNAAKYSASETAIAVEMCIDHEWVRIAVIDRGRGIAAEHLPRLFERFYRVPSEDGDVAAAPGFGLGLSIVRDLAEAHGGRIEVASRGVGMGSTFTVVLPLTLALESKRGTVGTGASA
jgi:signal transduction histidine kinase